MTEQTEQTEQVKRRVGRPSKGVEKRSCVIGFRLNARELDALSALQEGDESLNATARRLLLELLT